jgi:hypothetical protein
MKRKDGIGLRPPCFRGVKESNPVSGEKGGLVKLAAARAKIRRMIRLVV